MASKKILVTGVSGTGKTAVCRELAKRGVITIGIDETEHLSYWVEKKTRTPVIGDVDFSDEFLRTHEWVFDIQVLEKLVDRIKGSVVICGSADNIIECVKYCDSTLLLRCAPETFIARIERRSDNSYGQNDASKRALLGYYQRYNNEMLDAGAIPINAEQPIDGVINEILQYV